MGADPIVAQPGEPLNAPTERIPFLDRWVVQYANGRWDGPYDTEAEAVERIKAGLAQYPERMRGRTVFVPGEVSP